MTWYGDGDGVYPRPSIAGYVAMVFRGIGLLLNILLLIPLFYVLKLIGRLFPKLRLHRYIVRFWSRIACWLAGVRVQRVGKQMHQGGALVSNHISWFDTWVLNASADVYFIAKSEVQRWPVAGPMAKLCETVFVERRPTEAKRQQSMLLERLRQGHSLCFFPEGTSTDGLRVLEFKSALFGVFEAQEVLDELWVQPVTISYHPADHHEPHFYGWWGNMSFFGSLLALFATSFRGRARVIFHDAVRARDFKDRKAVAAYAQKQVLDGLIADQPKGRVILEGRQTPGNA